MKEQDVHKKKLQNIVLGKGEVGEVPLYITFILVAFRDENRGLTNGPSCFSGLTVLLEN